MATKTATLNWIKIPSDIDLSIKITATPFKQAIYIASSADGIVLNKLGQAGFRLMPTKSAGNENTRWIAASNFSREDFVKAFPDVEFVFEQTPVKDVYIKPPSEVKTAHLLGKNEFGEEVYKTFGNFRTVSNPKTGDSHVVELSRSNAENMLNPRYLIAWDFEKEAFNQQALSALSAGFVNQMLTRKMNVRDLQMFVGYISLGAVRDESSPHYRQVIESIESSLSAHVSQRISEGYTHKKAFDEAKILVDNQPALAARTGEQIALQQYSTPLTISTVAGSLLGELPTGARVLDPAVGTGMLLSGIASDVECFGMDIDSKRADSIARPIQFKKADSLKPATYDDLPAMDGVIINPPFGELPDGGHDDSMGVRLRRQDYLMSFMALERMKDDGRAVLITGADGLRSNGEIKGGSKYFLNKLYSSYNVVGAVELDGSKLYRKQDATVNVRMYYINGRGKSEMAVPTRLDVIKTTDELWSWRDSVYTEREFNVENERAENAYNEFQSRYQSRSQEGANIGSPLIPKNMELATIRSLDRIEDNGMSVDDYVREALQYPEGTNLGDYFSAPQIDAIALGIDAVARGTGNLIGDQTGFGKGRIMAAMLRYHLLRGTPILTITEKPKLFSDMWRDLEDIGSAGLIKPLILNAAKSDVFDTAGNKVAEHDAKAYKAFVESSGSNLSGANCVFATYSQFQNNTTSLGKQASVTAYLNRGGGAILADEAHNLAGKDSNTATFFADLTAKVDAVTFASATAIKNADSLAAYHRLFPPSVNFDNLMEFAKSGDASVMTTISYKLAENGSYIRRETPLDGIKFSSATYTDASTKDKIFEIATATTTLLREIASYSEGISMTVNAMDTEMKKALKDSDASGARSDLGVRSVNFGSRLHTINRQIMLMLKKDIAIEQTIAAIENNQKPVLASELTMGAALEALLEGMEPNEMGEYIFDEKPKVGTVFESLLERASFATKMTGFGMPERIDIRMQGEQDEEGKTPLYRNYERILKSIHDYKSILDEVSITFLDDIHEALEEKGYSMYEVSGRTMRGKTNQDGSYAVSKHKPLAQTIGLNNFNSGETDALFIVSGSGAAGLSAHASPKFDCQLQRKLIMIQASQDINKLVQMLGRVNRLDQVSLPEFMFTSTEIPSEQRENAANARKLQALLASTSANKESGLTALIGAHDFTNRIGDKAVVAVMKYEGGIATMLGLDIEKLTRSLEDNEVAAGSIVNKITGRFSLLPPGPVVDMPLESLLARRDEDDYLNQQLAYKLLEQEYTLLIRELEEAGINPFKANNNDWKARTVEESVFFEGDNHSDNAFDEPAHIKRIEYDIMVKPIGFNQVAAMIEKAEEEYEGFLSERGGITTMLADAQDIIEAKIKTRLLSGLSDYDTLSLVPEDDRTTKQNQELSFINKVESMNYDEMRRMILSAEEPMLSGTKNDEARRKAALEYIRIQDVIEAFMNKSTVGSLMRIKQGMLGIPRTAVITGITPPETKDYYGHLGHWKIKYVCPGDEKANHTSLYALATKTRNRDGEISIADFKSMLRNETVWTREGGELRGEAADQERFVSSFDSLRDGIKTISRTVITGNVVGALSKMGKGKYVIGSFTDENNISHVSIISPTETTIDKVMSQSIKVLAVNEAYEALTSLPCIRLGNDISNEGKVMGEDIYYISYDDDSNKYRLTITGRAAMVRKTTGIDAIMACLESDFAGNRTSVSADIKQGKLSQVIGLCIDNLGGMVCDHKTEKEIKALMDSGSDASVSMDA